MLLGHVVDQIAQKFIHGVHGLITGSQEPHPLKEGYEEDQTEEEHQEHPSYHGERDQEHEEQLDHAALGSGR